MQMGSLKSSKKQLCRYVACEDIDFEWDDKDVHAFDKAWNSGWSIEEIAHGFARDPDEIVILIIDRARQGKIHKRQIDAEYSNNLI